MEIIVLKLRPSEISNINIFEYLNTNYSKKVFVRAFISSLYFDTLVLEVLFL
jgi:hypothetical protein